MSIIDYAKTVLRVEAEAVAAQIDRCGEDFECSVQAVLAMDERGRFVISGMGKAGLIGEKISATLASTGTPSLFLHPAEAVHGDLGRLSKHDIVLLMSNSGETEEIVRLVEVLKKTRVKTLIALTGGAQSSLAKLSDYVLDIGNLDEACPLGLAPSASTTAMLAVGDALTLSILKMREFGPADYARFHPGGSLGRSLLRVHEVMRSGAKNVRVQADTILADVLAEITQKRTGAALVVDSNGSLQGIFTDGDLRRHLQSDASILQRPIAELMTKDPKTIASSELCTSALTLMREYKIDELPVLDDDANVCGIIDVQDLLTVGLV